MAAGTLTSLELFLLALVDRGWKTPYRLKEAAGISVGAALPALNRLKGRKLLQRAELGARNKQEFEVTSAGRKAITREMKNLIDGARETPPGDVESVLRLAGLAFFTNRQGIAVSLLKSAGESGRRLAKLKPQHGHQLPAGDLASLYRAMNEICEAARSQAESEAMITLADHLSRIRLSEKPHE